MKIAIPTRENMVDDHFGHCQFYTVYEVDENRNIVSTEHVPSPEGCGCKSNIASVLSQMGVKLMLAGNMGDGAKNVLEKNNIKVLRGCSGPIDKLMENYKRGIMVDSGVSCDHHDCHSH